MIDLAMHNNGEYITIKSIAARQEISEKYLEQIIPALTRCGFVKSVRGAQGGYCLAKPLEFYTVGMIFRVTEGDLAPVACAEEGSGSCDRYSLCVSAYVYERLHKAINDVVDNITLADLVERQKITEGSNYYI